MSLHVLHSAAFISKQQSASCWWKMHGEICLNWSKLVLACGKRTALLAYGIWCIKCIALSHLFTGTSGSHVQKVEAVICYCCFSSLWWCDGQVLWHLFSCLLWLFDHWQWMYCIFLIPHNLPAQLEIFVHINTKIRQIMCGFICKRADWPVARQHAMQRSYKVFVNKMGSNPTVFSLFFWQGGRPLVWDLTTVCLLAEPFIAAAVREAGSAAELVDHRKSVTYTGIHTRYAFQPIVIELLGSVSESACKFVDSGSQDFSSIRQWQSV